MNEIEDITEDLRNNGLSHFLHQPIHKIEETIKFLAYDKSSNARKNTYLLNKLIKARLNQGNTLKI